MRVMVLVKATAESEAGKHGDEKLFGEMSRYNEELVKAGVLVAGEGLHPTSKGKRVRFSGATRTVVDGPFAETKELVAGFWVWQVQSMDEAVQWLKRAPCDVADVEIRPIFETADFGDALSPELRAKEESLRAQVAAKAK
jgi:hypothetical protein